MRMTRSGLAAAVGLLIAIATLAAPHVQPGSAAEGLTPRATLAMLAYDPPIPPAPDPSYCPGATNPPSLPVSIFGTLTAGGTPMPAGTLVQVLLDGVVGPGAYTTQAGGYKVDFHVRGAGCPNKIGAVIGVLVNGRRIDSIGTVNLDSGPLRIDVVVP